MVYGTVLAAQLQVVDVYGSGRKGPRPPLVATTYRDHTFEEE